MAGNFHSTKPLSIGQQIAIMRMRWREFDVRRRDGRMLATGKLRPTAMNAEYHIRMEYGWPHYPGVYVNYPRLRGRKGVRPPHLYPHDRLCLFWPVNREWNGSMYIADTIIPWAAEWLIFYESWLVTGEWQGGGEHPDPHTPEPTQEQHHESRGRWSERAR